MKDIVTMFMSESKLSLLSYNNSDKGNEMNVIPVLLKMFHEFYPSVKPYITIDGIGITHEILGLLKEYEYDFVIVYKNSKEVINECSKLLTNSFGEAKDNPDEVKDGEKLTVTKLPIWASMNYWIGQCLKPISLY